MAANTDPIYTRTADIQSLNGAVAGPTANTGQDGTSSATSMYSVAQADTTEGGFFQKIVARAVGSPAATVLRIYVCTVTGALTIGTSNTAANTFLLYEVALPAVTLSQTAATQPIEIPLNLALPAGYRLLASFGTSTGASGTGYVLTAIGGKY